MTLEEAKKAIDGFKAEGMTDEEIVVVLHDMFVDDKLTIDELAELVGLVGYEITEEFRNMSPEEQKERLYDEVDEGKEPESGTEGPGEGKDEIDAGKPESETKVEEESEEEKARKLFGLNK